MSERGNMRVGKTADGTGFCIGFDRPLNDFELSGAVDAWLGPKSSINEDGTQTVMFFHKAFGWVDAERWEYFAAYATQVAEYLGDVTLDLSRVQLKLGEESTLFGNLADTQDHEA